MKAENPLRQRDMTPFHDRADRHGEMLAAGIALEQTGTRGLSMQPGDSLDLAAMWAERATRPNPSLEPFAGFVFIVENGVAKMAGHGGCILLTGALCLTADALSTG